MGIVEFLINLSIAIVALDVSIYSISVTLLSSQLRKNDFYIKRRLKETEAEIKKIQEENSSASGRITGIEERINDFKDEKNHLEKNLKCLTLKGAVLIPLVPIVINLILGAILLVFPVLNQTSIFTISETIFSVRDIFLIISIILFGFGAFRMYCTLRSIDFAVTHTPLPELFVAFTTNAQSSLSVESKEEIILSIDVVNYGYDLAELVEVAILFPPEFKIRPSKDYDITKQPSANSQHPKFTAVTVKEDTLHVDTSISIDVIIETPSKKGTYKLPVYLNEKTITQDDFELELNVT